MINREPGEMVRVALEKEVTLYRRLAKLAEIQHEHIGRDDAEGLLTVLGQRQLVLDDLGELERTVGPARRRWQDFLQELPTGLRQTIETLMLQTRELLEVITASDRNDTMILQQRKLNVGHQLNQAKKGQQAQRGYTNNVTAYRNTANRSTLDIHK